MDWGFCFSFFVCLFICEFFRFFEFPILKKYSESLCFLQKVSLLGDSLCQNSFQVSLHSEQRKHHLHISHDSSVNTPQMHQFRDLACKPVFVFVVLFFKDQKTKSSDVCYKIPLPT